MKKVNYLMAITVLFLMVYIFGCSPDTKNQELVRENNVLKTKVDSLTSVIDKSVERAKQAQLEAEVIAEQAHIAAEEARKANEESQASKKAADEARLRAQENK